MQPPEKPETDKLRRLLRCANEDEFLRQRAAVLASMREQYPKGFQPNASMRTAITAVAAHRGLSFEEQLEETVIGAYLVQQSFSADEISMMKRAVAEASQEKPDEE